MLILRIFFTMIVVACTINATSAAELDLGKVVPTSITEAVSALKKSLSPQILKDLKEAQRKDIQKFNSSLGMDIRNEWIWGRPRSPLANFFFNAGIRNPDHISGAILVALWRDLHGESADTSKLLNEYKLAEFRSQDFVKESVVIPKSLLR